MLNLEGVKYEKGINNNLFRLIIADVLTFIMVFKALLL